jgi:hypothetical protein
LRVTSELLRFQQGDDEVRQHEHTHYQADDRIEAHVSPHFINRSHAAT